MKKLLAIVTVAALALLMVCCAPESTDYKSDELQFSPLQSGATIAVFSTSKGVFRAVLYPDYAPQNVANFVALAKSGFYDGMEFHRVVADLLIQSGDPTETGTGGNSASGQNVPNEFCNELRNYKGALGMASSATGDNLSQFYIVTQDKIDALTADKLRASGFPDSVVAVYEGWGGAAHLDFRYTVFGQVIEGLDVVEKIADVKTDEFNRPKHEVVLKSVTIEIAP